MLKPSITALILTKNEESNLRRALSSLKELVNETIIIDSGSTDGTLNIASEFGAKVFHRDWDSYPNQLNYGLNLCRSDWIIIIDADEELSEELRINILSELKNPRFNVYKICRKCFYLGKYLNYVWSNEWRVRLFRRGSVKFDGDLHEKPVFSDRVGKIEGFLYHYPVRDLTHHFQKCIYYAKKSAEIKFKKGERFSIYKLVASPIWHFNKIYFIKCGFLDGWRGLLIALVSVIYKITIQLFLFEIMISNKK